MRSVLSRLVTQTLAMVVIFGCCSQLIAAQNMATPDSKPSTPEVLFAAYPEGGQEGLYFEELVEPGEGHEFSLVLQNAGGQPLGLLIYPADVESMANGGMGVNFQDHERTEPTTWLNFPEGIVEINAGEELVQSFTVTVPEGTEPGQYVTAIGVETVDSYAVGEEGGAFRQVLRKVVAVVIIVPGPADPGFAIGEPEVLVQQGQTVLRLPIENTGNIRVRPAGTVTLTGANGNEVATGDVAMGSVYMGDTAPYELWMPTALAPGEYSVSADLEDPDTGVSDTIEDVRVTIVREATPVPVVQATPVVQAAPTPTPVPEPVRLQDVVIEANSDPIQFANVAFEIENTGNHVSRARVTLVAMKDGDEIERYEIDDNLPLEQGTTEVSARYIPPTGWESGTWTFSVEVHAINPNENVETLLIDDADIATIEVP